MVNKFSKYNTDLCIFFNKALITTSAVPNIFVLIADFMK